MSALKSALRTDPEIASAIGLALEEYQKLYEPKPETPKPTPQVTSPKAVSDLSKLLKGRTEREKHVIRIQGALEEILNPTIKVYRDNLGGKFYIRVSEENIAVESSLEWVVAYAAKKIQIYDIFITNRELAEHVKTWSDKVDGLNVMPPSFSLDPKELTFNRILVELLGGPTPTWDYFISKCGPNGEALMAFVWSLLCKEDCSQQYLLLKGEGEDGKGSLIRWLERLFNDQVVGLCGTDKYWAAQCVGKRIGVFNDINNTSIVMSSQFKQATGGDKLTIEQKYEKAFSLRLDTKFILTTNRSVNTISDKAERRRAILVEIISDNTVIVDYEEKLKEEGPAFLAKCEEFYGKLYDKTTKRIKCDYSLFESESASYEEPYEALFCECFTLDEKSRIKASDFYKRVTKEITKDNQKVNGFKEWMKRTYGITRSKNSAGTWEYKGMRMKACS